MTLISFGRWVVDSFFWTVRWVAVTFHIASFRPLMLKSRRSMLRQEKRGFGTSLSRVTRGPLNWTVV